jgi:hypothetical protein
VSATHSGEACEHAKGVRGKAWASTVDEVGRGWVGLAMSSRGRCCEQRKGKGAEGFCSPRNDASRTFWGEDGVAAAMMSDGSGSGSAPT